MYRRALVEGIGSVSKIAGCRAGYAVGGACGPAGRAQSGLATAFPACLAGQRVIQESHGKYQQQKVRGGVEPMLARGLGCTTSDEGQRQRGIPPSLGRLWT